MWILCVALPSASGNSGSWPSAYVETLGAALGHPNRIETIRQYCAGLLLPRDRQTIQPIAAGVEPGRVQATHQSLHHLIAKANSPDATMFALVHARVLPAIQQQARSKPGSPTIPTSRKRARTRSASRGNTAVNAASRTFVRSRSASRSPTSMRACRWPSVSICRSPAPRRRPDAAGPGCRGRCPSPPSRKLRLSRSAPRRPTASHPASCGRRRLRPDSGFRDGITAVGPTYVVGIQSAANLWPPSQTPLPVKPCGGRGRPSSRVRRSRYRKPVSVRELAAALPDTA